MGCVYILRNPAMPGLIKIGYTTRTAEDRARELYEGALGVPKPFVIAHINDCEEPRELEAAVHERLAKHRINKNREFFKCSADDAYELVKDLHKESQQERKPLLIWEKIKPLLSWKTIIKKIIESFLWTSIANLLWDPLKSLGTFIWNLFRGHH